MFGFSFGELVVLVVVAIVVIGPKDLPKVLRQLGQWAGKLRRMAADLRAQSGIDDVLRTEGLTDDLNEIRKLARGELDSIRRSADVRDDQAPALSTYEASMVTLDREREQPRDGPDTGNAMPDTAFIYADGFPRSKWATDPVWVLADPDGVIPTPPPAPELPPLAVDDHNPDGTPIMTTPPTLDEPPAEESEPNGGAPTPSGTPAETA